MIQNRELHDQIMAFDIDGGPSQYTFARKLAKQQRWTLEYTERVIGEYKRFLYLGAVEGPVSPSPQVDEAWHLHLTYTVSYWEHLCGEVLGKPFHHHPSRGRNESVKYSKLSETTIEKYRRVFSEKPPEDIWSTPPARAEVWTVPKPKAKRFLAFAGLSFAIIVAGCTSSNSEASLLPFFVVGLLFFAIVVTIIVAIAQAGKRERNGGQGGTGGGTGFYGCGTSHTMHSNQSNGDASTNSHGHGGGHAGEAANPDASTDTGGQSAVSESNSCSSSDSSSSSGGDASSGCGGGCGGGGD
ncbi:MAG: hypothetical protein ABL949_02990 [Fimbriimonadaceae bacterium]